MRTRKLLLSLAALMAAPLLLSAEPAKAEQRAVGTSADVKASMWIWADRYVYRPGESLTLRWTLKTNDDAASYTITAYRLNNQTGERTFLPRGTAAATDIFGNTIAQGFRAAPLQAATKAVLVGAGGALIASPLTIPNELGMHTIVVQLRNEAGTKILKSAFFKIGVVDEIVTVRGGISANTRWVNTKAYRVEGVNFVRNATLEIEPGTFVLGAPGTPPDASSIIITRNARIIADGTQSRPIIMTSSRTIGERQRGDWGGLGLLGNARINIPGGQAFLEGLPESPDTQYGGTDDNHSCGSLRYVRVEFAGAALGPGNELNGVTYGGCGKLTYTDHVQVHQGFDDGFEMFGGTNDAKYVIVTYTGDDAFDFDYGYQGRIQYGLAVTNGTPSNRGIESDGNRNVQTARPATLPVMFNMSFVGNQNSTEEDSGSIAALWFRRGSGGSINNTLVYNWNQGAMEIRDPATANMITENLLTVNGLHMWDNGKDLGKANTVEGQTRSANTPAEMNTALQALLAGTTGRGANVAVADTLLRRPLEYSDPDFRPLPNSPALGANWILPPDDGFFDQSATFIGAFGDDDWTFEWTNFVQEEDLRP